MTNQEFSDQFDILYNNISSNQAPGLDEYEKSVFLTKAQSEILKEYFNSRVDKTNGGFDGSEKRQYDFSKLIRVATLYDVNSFNERITEEEKLDYRSKIYLFPSNYFLSVNEIISDQIRQYSVLPLRYEEYQRLMQKPYSYPTKRSAWRLFSDKKNCNYVEEYVTNTSDNSEINTDINYQFLSTWSDQKRNLKLKVYSKKSGQTLSIPSGASKATMDAVLDGIKQSVTIGVQDSNTIYAEVTWDESHFIVKLECDSGWKGSEFTYSVFLTLDTGVIDVDDHGTVEIIRVIFDCYKRYIEQKGTSFSSAQSDIAKAARHVDGFQQFEAPGKLYKFQDSSNQGYTFITECIQLPYAEIIGNFTGKISYKLRYVKTPSPIILTNLSGVKIDGIDRETPCELPAQIHPEILERAVTLAKISYTHGTTETLSGLQAAKQQSNQ